MASQKACLIDGTAFCYRAFYAIRDLSTADGRPTNAVYGFAMMLQALQHKERPDYLAVAFDVGKPTFRHQKFEAYKSQRKPMPDALIGQLPLVKRLLAAYRIPIFEKEGYEAEDVLATIAKRIAQDGVEVFLVTGDKDALQLVNSHVKVYNPHHDDQLLDAQAVQERFGVGPDRMVDLMALMGDDIDNIPGVRGIGEKTATQLLQRFGSLEQLYRHLDELESAHQRKQLAESKEQVMLSRELARIDCEVPVEVSLGSLHVAEPDVRALRALFRELEFKRLLRALERETPEAPTTSARVHLVQTPQELDALLTTIDHATIALGCWPVDDPASAVILAMASSHEEAWVLIADPDLWRTPAGKRCRLWLADPASPKLCHDAKSAMRLLRKMGAALGGVAGDTMVAAHLLNPARTEQTLSDVADEYLQESLGPVPVFAGRLGLGSSKVLAPCAHAACAVRRLNERLQDSLAVEGLEGLYRELEIPLVSVLAQMEATGVAVDVPYLDGLRATMDAKLNGLTEDIFRLAGVGGEECPGTIEGCNDPLDAFLDVQRAECSGVFVRCSRSSPGTWSATVTGRWTCGDPPDGFFTFAARFRRAGPGPCPAIGSYQFDSITSSPPGARYDGGTITVS